MQDHATENHCGIFGSKFNVKTPPGLSKNPASPTSPTQSSPPAAQSSPQQTSELQPGLFNRVVENVKPSHQGFGFAEENYHRGYELFGTTAASLNSSLNSSTSSTISILDESSSSSNATLLASSSASTTSIDDGLQLTPTRTKVWSKNNATTMPPRLPLNENKQNEQQADCDLCYTTYQWPLSPQLQGRYPQTSLRFELRPVLSCCKCTPCQCTFESNYCGCHSLGQGPC